MLPQELLERSSSLPRLDVRTGSGDLRDQGYFALALIEDDGLPALMPPLRFS